MTKAQDAREIEAIAEIDTQIALSRSKVKPTYKIAYKERAISKKQKGKAAKRSTWDWLAQQMATIVLDENEKLVVPRLEALLEANGVDHSKWNRTTPGWMGRLRMTGRLCLAPKVASAQQLIVPGEEPRIPTRAFIAKFGG